MLDLIKPKNIAAILNKASKPMDVTCPVCGNHFTPVIAGQIYCSVKCRKKNENSRRTKDDIQYYNNIRKSRAKPYETPDFLGIDGEAIKDGWAMRMPVKLEGDSYSYTILSEGKNYLFVDNFNNAFFLQSHYVMLQVDKHKPLFADCLLDESLPVKRLSTPQILDYLISLPKAFYVGYYLGYDFQEWLHDLSLAHQDEIFEQGKEVIIKVIDDGNKTKEYAVSAIKKKFLTIRIPNYHTESYFKVVKDGDKWTLAKDSHGNPIPKFKVLRPGESRRDDGVVLNEYGIPKLSHKEFYCQDYSGYWQMSFEAALSKNKSVMDDGDKEIIANGKALRNKFNRKYWKQIAEYNATECKLMSRMMRTLFDDIAHGFKTAGIKIIPRGKDAYSPGALSNKAFKSLKWTKSHPIFNTESFRDDFNATLEDEYLGKEGVYVKSGVRCDDWRERLQKFPFLAAYFGGRIEASKVGMIKPLIPWGEETSNKQMWSLWNGDIRSAYPKAISMMPEWNENDAIWLSNPKQIKTAIDKRKAGMYLLKWNLPRNWVWYPFPYRSKTDGVMFPQYGTGWVSSLEYYAFIDSCPAQAKDVKVLKGLVIDGTDNIGFVDLKAPPPTQTGQFFEKMYDERAIMKKAKNPGEKALKLTPNGMYGKLIQQVGVRDWKDDKKLKNFSDFAAMWTTAYCRATIWLAIAEYKHDKNGVFAIQTDGVYSQKPLNLDTRNKLGCWEIEEEYGYAWFLMYMPGIYAYSVYNADGSHDDYELDNNGNIKDFLHVKRRGWSKEFNMLDSWNALKSGKDYILAMDSYISPVLSNLQANRYSVADLAYSAKSYTNIYNSAINKNIKQDDNYATKTLKNGGCEWAKIYKKLTISLGSKRRCGDDGNADFTTGKETFYFPPRHIVFNSIPEIISDICDNVVGQRLSKPYIPVFINPFSMEHLAEGDLDSDDDYNAMNVLASFGIEDYEGGTGGGVFER